MEVGRARVLLLAVSAGLAAAWTEPAHAQLGDLNVGAYAGFAPRRYLGNWPFGYPEGVGNGWVLGLNASHRVFKQIYVTADLTHLARAEERPDATTNHFHSGATFDVAAAGFALRSVELDKVSVFLQGALFRFDLQDFEGNQNPRLDVPMTHPGLVTGAEVAFPVSSRLLLTTSGSAQVIIWNRDLIAERADVFADLLFRESPSFSVLPVVTVGLKLRSGVRRAAVGNNN
jgi:hypothetical protein